MTTSSTKEQSCKVCTRPTRSVQVALFLLLSALLIGTQSHAVQERLTSSQRAHLLMTRTEVAEHILLGTVLDTAHVVGDDGWGWTRYTTRTDTLLKGTPFTDSVATLTEGGPFASPQLEIGMQYLLFLARCPPNNWRRIICPACLATIDGETARPRNPDATVSISALLDSVRTFLEPCSIEYQRAVSDLAVVGTLENVMPADSTQQPMQTDLHLEVEVQAVLGQWRSEAPKAGERIDVVALHTEGLNPPRTGTRPILTPRGIYLLFLEQDGDNWLLGNSVYAAWRKEGDLGLVEAKSYPCPHTVATENWDRLVSQVSSTD